MNQPPLPSSGPADVFDPRHNITAKELDRDLINLQLSEIDMIATEEECAALYAPGVFEQMMKIGKKEKPA
jgi:hypothetical protein